MSIHHLKIQRQPFEDLVSGRKTGEVRNCADREFREGDQVELFLIDETGNPANKSIVRTITHIQRGYGLPDDICVLSYSSVLSQEAGHVEEPLGMVDPVAWRYKKTYQKGFWAVSLVEPVAAFLLDEEKHDIEPLYTSPPAPVAVPVEIHQQLIEMRQQFERANFVALGKLLTACLDKVKELNQ